MRKLIFPAISVLIFLVSCKNEDRGNEKDSGIYLDYSVWADNESDNVTIKLQYRAGGADGKPFLLATPANVKLDGEAISPDSSKWNGIYYELRKPLKDFSGSHEIVFTDAQQKQHKEPFDFQAFSFKKEMPLKLGRNELVFELQGLEAEEYLQVMLSDTSFYGREIDRVDTVSDGRVSISPADLYRIKSGPVHLEIYKDRERTISGDRGVRGSFFISYKLRKEFELTD